jgi:hypothetical protein
LECYYNTELRRTKLFRRYISPQVKQHVCGWRVDADLTNHPDHLPAMHRGMIGDVLHLID